MEYIYPKKLQFAAYGQFVLVLWKRGTITLQKMWPRKAWWMGTTSPLSLASRPLGRSAGLAKKPDQMLCTAH